MQQGIQQRHPVAKHKTAPQSTAVAPTAFLGITGAVERQNWHGGADELTT